MEFTLLDVTHSKMDFCAKSVTSRNWKKEQPLTGGHYHSVGWMDNVAVGRHGRTWPAIAFNALDVWMDE